MNGHGNDGITLPKWFLWVLSGTSALFVALFVPWGIWVSVTLMTISIKTNLSEHNFETMTVLNKQVVEHQTSIAEHRLQYTDLERRVQILERKQ